MVSEDRSDIPLVSHTSPWWPRFVSGDADFEQIHTPASGLGPVYIRPSCASCHADDARGPGFVEKMAPVDEDADLSLLFPWGRTIRPLTSVNGAVPVTPPAGVPIRRTRRAAPAVFGRGYLEAIADEAIEAIAVAQAADNDGIAGRINRVPWQSAIPAQQPFANYAENATALIGRFGLKARIATIDGFVADAYQGDMGLTSEARPEELPNPAGMNDDLKPRIDVPTSTVHAVADYVRLLRIPPRRSWPAGEHLFRDIGCAVCHVPELAVRADYPITEIASSPAPVYTDMLLHRMGPDRGDGISEFAAAGDEWRTAPLIGVRFLRSFLHDGSAKTVTDAILAHGAEGSEAATTVSRFRALDEDQQLDLVRFVYGL